MKLEDFPEIMALRADFAIEAGFLDIVRKPLNEALRVQVGRMTDMAGRPVDFDLLNARKARYELPRYMGYYYAATCAFVTDGGNQASVRYFGLFLDMLNRVKSAAARAGLSDGFSNPIVLSDDAFEAEPGSILVHDTAGGRCRLAPFQAGLEFLRTQGRS
ncbi:MAG: hypothetical protein ABSA05_16250 [Opitutaceae bacterium]|jgi:hypothetical protein